MVSGRSRSLKNNDQSEKKPVSRLGTEMNRGKLINRKNYHKNDKERALTKRTIIDSLLQFGDCVTIEADLATSQEFVYRINGSRANLFLSIPKQSLLVGSLCLQLVQKFKPYNKEIIPLPPTKQQLHPLTLFRLNLTNVNIAPNDLEQDVYNRTIINFGLVSDIPPTYPNDPYSLRAFVMNGTKFQFLDGGNDEPTDRYEFFIPYAYQKSKLIGVFTFNEAKICSFGQLIPIPYRMKVKYPAVNEIKDLVVGFSHSSFFPPSTPVWMVPNMVVRVSEELYSPLQLNLVPLGRYLFESSTSFPNMTLMSHILEFKTHTDFFVTQDRQLVEIDRKSLHCLYIYNQKVIAKEGIYTNGGSKPRLICKPNLKNDINRFELLVLARIKNPTHPHDDVKILTLKNNIQKVVKLLENSRATFKFTLSGRSRVRIDIAVYKSNEAVEPPISFYYGMGYAPTNVDFDFQTVGTSFTTFNNEYDIPVDLIIIAYTNTERTISILGRENVIPPKPIDSYRNLSDDYSTELTILIVAASVLLVVIVLVCLGTIFAVAFIMKKNDNNEESLSLLGKSKMSIN